MKRMFLRMAALILTLLMLFSAYGCQPTPDTPPVVNKGENRLEDLIASSVVTATSEIPQDNPRLTQDPDVLTKELRDKIGAPDTCKISYTNKKGDVTVSIDAKTDVPATAMIPAIKLKLSEFTQEQVDQFAAYFLRGAAVYTEDRHVKTKEEIMPMIIELYHSLERVKKDTNRVNRQSTIDDIERQIAEMEKKYEAAPEKRERTPATLVLNNTDHGTHLSVVADLDKDGAASFSVGNTAKGSSLSFSNAGKGGYHPMRDNETFAGVPRGMTTSLEEAKRIVMQCLSDLGITNMQIEKVSAATFHRDINDMNSKEYNETAKQCYVFNLQRLVSGIPVPHIDASTANDTDDPSVPAPVEPDYDQIIEPERLEIYVDDSGIVDFYWHYPVEEERVMSENVDLMRFDEIVKRAKEYMFYKTYTASNCKADIYITGIKLSMMRIRQKDKPNVFLMVPVWDFIGNRQDIIEDIAPKWLPFGDQSYVTINAIDGSCINRDWGY